MYVAIVFIYTLKPLKDNVHVIQAANYNERKIYFNYVSSTLSCFTQDSRGMNLLCEKNVLPVYCQSYFPCIPRPPQNHSCCIMLCFIRSPINTAMAVCLPYFVIIDDTEDCHEERLFTSTSAEQI